FPSSPPPSDRRCSSCTSWPRSFGHARSSSSGSCCHLLKRRGQYLPSFVELRFRQVERWHQPEHVVVWPATEHHHSGIEADLPDLLLQVLVGRSVLVDEFDPHHQPESAHLADRRQTPLQIAQTSDQLRALGRRILENPLALEDVKGRDAGGAGHRIAAEGR